MKILRVLLLLTSIFLVLVSVTASWMIVDCYQRYGWSWQETTTIGEVSEERWNSVVGQAWIVVFLWYLTFLTFASYRSISKLKKTAASMSEDVNP